MKGSRLAAIGAAGFITVCVGLHAQDRRPPPPPPRPGDVHEMIDDLGLSADQRATVDPLVTDLLRQQRLARDAFLKKVRPTLSAEQYQQLYAALTHDGPPHHDGDDRSETSPATWPAVPLAPLAAGERRVAVTFTGGHDTDRRDGGRPVRLVAAGLGVTPEVFRETFTHVHPAGPGSGGPTDAEARQNKAALMAGLSPYGVTDDQINTVSNYYRYIRSRDGLWRHRDATASAIVSGGMVVRFELADPGAGYTTVPIATVEGMPEVAVTATLVFGKDLATNGSIARLSAGS